MSKDRKKLLHIHSSVNDKQPTPATLELGELGVNNAKGNAFISTKNSEGEVVRFSEDETVIGWMEQKEVFPYEGYMRGADNSQVDGVTEQDLLDNKSNLIIKLNQVVPENTDYSPYDEKVNGAKDIYGNLINPISSGGYKDGAGLAIDMSNYAMIGANPSFSSITTTCHATLNGTTEIKGKGDGCGSKFTVEVANACIDVTDTLNEYGVSHSNFGTSCDGTKISNDTTLKGKKIFIDSPSGDLTVDIQACNHISGRTNDFVIRECQDNAGKVEIDSTTVKVSASTTDVKSCDRISALTNDFQVKECAANGKAGITSTTINNSATTITEEACNGISEVTNDFNVTECTNGQGSAKIESCKEFNVKSNNIVLEQCGAGQGNTKIKSCSGITLESKNIILTDGDCGNGEITIETNDLCLVGNEKINVYGDKTNIGLDCDDSAIATSSRVFGKGTLITSKETPAVYPAENNVEVVAAQDIKENADRDIVETAGNNITETAVGNITESTTNGNINENAKNIYNTATNNICDQASNEATFYGASSTNVGVNCDDTATAATTTVKGEKVNVDASATNLELTAKEDILETAEKDITIHANNILCESGKTVSVFAGEGGKLTIGGNSCDGNTEGTYPITYVRRPKTGTCDIHATTVDDALDEVYDRSRISLTSTAHTTSESSYTEYTLHQDSEACDASINFTVNDTIVSMSAETYPASSEMLKKYTIWQYVGGEKKDIGVIDIPKDHLLKDVSVVWGTLDGDTFTPCTQASENCHWYIKLVWNVFDPDSGHSDDKITYLPADDFVKDINKNNSDTDRGVNVDVWYDGKQNLVSATTKVTIKNADGTGTKEFFRENGFHSLSSYTLNCVSGDVKTNNAATNWAYDPFEEKVTITAATDASHINRKTVSWSYGDVKSAVGDTYDPGAGTVNTMTNRTMSFVIPKSVDNLNRGTLTYTHNGFTNTFDPASNSVFNSPHSALTISYGSTCDLTETSIVYDTSDVKSIVVPKTISDVTGGKITTDCSNGCTTLNGDLCASGVVKATALYSTSDERLKENVLGIRYEDYHKASEVNLKSFNFKDDETKTKTYGVIAQHLQGAGLGNIVHEDDKGNLSVDYISFLILRIADLENTVRHLSEKIKEVEDNKR